MNLILKRILWSIPTILIILVLGFFILDYSQKKTLENLLNYNAESDNYQSIDKIKGASYFTEKYHLDLPSFYFSINSSKSSIWIPQIEIHTKNKFHIWLFGDEESGGFLRGDWGYSFKDQKPVKEKICYKLIWSIYFSVVSIFIVYLISIPLGMWLASKKAVKLKTGFRFFLIALYSIPVFLMAIGLQMLFASNDFINLLPASGILPLGRNIENTSFFTQLKYAIPYTILPIICYTYSSLAYITQITQNNSESILTLPYIITAKSKGLSNYQIFTKHVFRNILLPLITIFVQVFPLMVGGSVIVETIFSIPGMGNEVFMSSFEYDAPVLISIIILMGIFSIFSFLLADILYYLIDPRLR